MRSYSLSQRRAEWLVLEHERPFLGPLYKFFTLHHRKAVRRIPPYVVFILRYLGDQIRKQRRYSLCNLLRHRWLFPRVDAEVSEMRTRLGGWFPTRGDDGEVSVGKSPWFSLEVTFHGCTKGETSQDWSSPLWKPLAVVIALKLRYGQDREKERTKVMLVPSITDNRCNGAALNKLMATKFLSSAVLMLRPTGMLTEPEKQIRYEKIQKKGFDDTKNYKPNRYRSRTSGGYNDPSG